MELPNPGFFRTLRAELGALNRLLVAAHVARTVRISQVRERERARAVRTRARAARARARVARASAYAARARARAARARARAARWIYDPYRLLSL